MVELIFQIVEEAEKVFGIYSLAAGIDILRIDNDPLRFTIDPDNEGFNFGIRTSTPPEALTVQWKYKCKWKYQDRWK